VPYFGEMQALFQTDSWEDQMHKNTPSLTGALFAGALSAAVTIVVLFSSIGFWALLAACVSGPTIGFLAYKPVELWKSFKDALKKADEDAKEARISNKQHISWILAHAALWLVRPTQLIPIGVAISALIAMHLWTPVSIHFKTCMAGFLLLHFLYTGFILVRYTNPAFPEAFRAERPTEEDLKQHEKNRAAFFSAPGPRLEIVSKTIKLVLASFLFMACITGIIFFFVGFSLEEDEAKDFDKIENDPAKHWRYVKLAIKRDVELLRIFAIEMPSMILNDAKNTYQLLFKEHHEATQAFFKRLWQEITVVCKVYIGAMFLWALSLTHSSERVIAAIDGTLGVLITFAAFSWIGGPHFLEAGVLWQFPFLSCGAFLGVLIGLINYELVAIRWLPKAQEKLADLQAQKTLLFNPSM
jgi:hypothetical protein